MSEHDNKLEELFARNELDTDIDSEAFVALVHQRVVKQRRINSVLELCVYVPIALAAGTIVVIAPEVLVYPVQLIHEMLSSPVGAAAAALVTIGLAWWSWVEEV